MASNRNQCVVYDCAICKIKLSQLGPQLHELSFGKLFDADRTPEETQLLLNEFPGYEAVCNRYARESKNEGGMIIYDCNKIMVTPCGHLFHTGCLREWYYTTRNNRYPKCPYCNQFAHLSECILVYPVEGPVDCSSSCEGLVKIKTAVVPVQSRGTNTEKDGQISSVPLQFDSDLTESYDDESGDDSADQYDNTNNELRFEKLSFLSENKFGIAIFLFVCYVIMFQVYNYVNSDQNDDSKTTSREVEPIYLGYYWAVTVALSAICSVLCSDHF